MQVILRYLRALIKTVGMVIGGQKLPQTAHLSHRRWAERTLALVSVAMTTADQQGMDSTQRKALKTKIDGREMSLQTTLEAVRYHAKEEYPYLLMHLTDNSLTTIEATNVNDLYALDKFLANSLISDEKIRGTLVTLRAHLHQIPNKN